MVIIEPDIIIGPGHCAGLSSKEIPVIVGISKHLDSLVSTCHQRFHRKASTSIQSIDTQFFNQQSTQFVLVVDHQQMHRNGETTEQKVGFGEETA